MRLRLDPGWYGRVVHIGAGYNPEGLAVVLVANFRLPDTADDCEGLLPRLSRREAIIRISDYGYAAGPGFRRVATVRPGRIRTVHAWAARTRGFAHTRVRLAGRPLAVDVSYGARRPPATTLRAVRRILASMSPVGTD